MADVTLEIDDFEDLVEESIEEAIAAGILSARQSLLRRIPAKRRKTRKNIVHHHRGLTGQVGVRFPPGSRFPKRGTETKRIVEDAWRQIEEPTLNAIKKTITDSVEEFAS